MDNITSHTIGSDYTAMYSVSPELDLYNIGTEPPLFVKIGITLVIAFGIIGNCIIIKVYMSSKQMRTPTNIFIVNLAVVDLTFLLSSISSLNTILLDGKMAYGELGCTIIAFLMITTAASSLLTMGLIAIARYVSIVHPQKKHLLSWKTCTCLCLLSWIYGSLLTIPAVTGWGRLGYNKFLWDCSFDWTYNISYNVLIFCSSIGVTSVIVCFCYANIYWVFRRSKKRVAGENNSGRKKGPRKNEIRLALQLLVIFGIYNICWLPFFIVVVIVSPNGDFSPWVYGLICVIAYWNFAVNILVYLYFNSMFRAHVKQLCSQFSFSGSIGTDQIQYSSTEPKSVETPQ